jgi:uncharacterized FlgJ-related protein
MEKKTIEIEVKTNEDLFKLIKSATNQTSLYCWFNDKFYNKGCRNIPLSKTAKNVYRLEFSSIENSIIGYVEELEAKIKELTGINDNN